MHVFYVCIYLVLTHPAVLKFYLLMFEKTFAHTLTRHSKNCINQSNIYHCEL